MHLLAYKNEGETLGEMLDRVRVTHPELAESRMTYAGRLDPMAEGLVFILTDDDVHEKEKFLGLDKTYQIEILFGFASDTYDTLGIINDTLRPNNDDITCEKLSLVFSSFQKTFMQDYPRYSSKTVQGKPLWQHAKNGLHQLSIPQKEVTIYSIACESRTLMRIDKLLIHVTERISRVQGDFRQQEILNRWIQALSSFSSDTTFPIIRLTVECSSGTYMRVLADTIGKNIGVPAIAWSIKRTKLGNIDNTMIK